MKAPLAIAFLCILALCYLAWMQSNELIVLREDVGDLRLKLRDLEPKPKPQRKPSNTGQAGGAPVSGSGGAGGAKP